MPWGHNLILLTKLKTTEQPLPANLQSSLPSIESIEQALADDAAPAVR